MALKPGWLYSSLRKTRPTPIHLLKSMHFLKTLQDIFLGGGWNRTIFKVFTEFVIILLLLYILVLWPQSMWDLNSSTRNQTCTPCNERRSLNHWSPLRLGVWGLGCHPLAAWHSASYALGLPLHIKWGSSPRRRFQSATCQLK